AAATARTIATFVGPFEPERYATGWARTIELDDHRVLGTSSARGTEEELRHFRGWHGVARDIVVQANDVLRLQSDALLRRLTFSGPDRAGGGEFERPFISLMVFGSDGLLTCLEYFDADRDAEALARFGELTAEPAAAPRVQRRVRPNAATSNVARLEAAIAARDADALSAVFADWSQSIEHRLSDDLDRQGLLTTWPELMKAPDGTY